MISAPALAPLNSAAPTHLLCVLGPLTLGFEALTVREVMTLPLITPLCEAPPWVSGAVNVRGRVVPVVDLRAALQLEACAPRAAQSLVILERANAMVAVRVDEVRNVRPLFRDFAPFDDGARDDAPCGFVAGVARDGWDIVQLVNLSALFGAASGAGARARPPIVCFWRDARFRGRRADFGHCRARDAGNARPRFGAAL